MEPIGLMRGLRGLALACGLAAGPAAGAAENLSGAYLGARAAEAAGDLDGAARLYRRAADRDPGNPGLLEKAVMYAVAAGDVAGALPLAERLDRLAPESRNLPLLFAVAEIRAGAFPDCVARVGRSEEALGPILHALLRGWCLSVDDTAAADAAFDALARNPTLGALAGYHKALAHAVAGDLERAARILEATAPDFLAAARRQLRARAEILAATGRQGAALGALDAAFDRGLRDAGLKALRDRIAGGEAVAFAMVPDATAGGAEALYTVALVLGSGDQNRDYAVILAQLALHLDPAHPEGRLLLAELLEDGGEHDLALAALAAVRPADPHWPRAEIQRARVLKESGRPDEGIAALENLVRVVPEDLGAASALADALRQRERFTEAAAAYSRALALVPEVERRHWVLFYQRGIAYERSGRWDEAEADFRRALELEPDQPLVLNYLGYSLVELGRNLAEAEDMIRRAVRQRPDDGYITDSLAWVLYRLGRFEEAVEPMERAVSLVPFDPILNDHLGDILWKVGRRLEARFQWKRALSFGPEEKDLARILRKLELGLDAVLEEEAKAANGG